MEKLEQIDVIRERTGASYARAVEALKEADGNVLDAIIKIEEVDYKEEFQVKGHQVVDKVKKLIKKGNVTRIKVRKGDKVLLDVPITAGVIGTVIYPPLAVFGTITALATKCTIEVKRAGESESKEYELNNIDNENEL